MNVMGDKSIVLVTGAVGFIGSHTCQRLLLQENIQVIGLDNFDPFYDKALKKYNLSLLTTHTNFRFIEGSILDEHLLESIFSKFLITHVIHLAALAGVRPSIERPLEYYNVNVMGTANVLNQCVQHSVKRVLMASSSSVYGDTSPVPFSESTPVDQPISPYAASKKACEALAYSFAYNFNLPVACLRFFTVYGPRQRPEMAIHKFAKLIQEEKPIPLFNFGNCERDYTYVDDIVSGMMLVLRKEGLKFDIVNLGNCATITTRELVMKLAGLLGKTPHLNLLPAQPGDVKRTCADITHAQKTYGYDPKFPLDEGLKSFMTYFLNPEYTLQTS